MNISIKNITLVNFKGIRDLSIDISKPVTDIYGRNRSGKTTIADAINWCLFGKDSKGNTKFGLKTRDAEGKIIPNIEHTVTLTLLCDNVEHELKRSVSEKYNKLRGSDLVVFVGNTESYLVDGNSTTATDYKKFISGLIDENTFKAITTPSYFTSLSWQQQRQFLSEMVGNISNESIAGGDKSFGELLGILEQESLEEHLKHLGYQIKQVKEKLEDIPVRIKEQNKALPEEQDWSLIEKQLTEKEEELQKLQADLAKAKYNGGDELKKESIRKKIAFQQKRADFIRRSAQDKSIELNDKYISETKELNRKKYELESLIEGLQNKIDAHHKLKERTQETLDRCEEKAKFIRKEWADNKALRFEFDESETVCPTCGQPLPEDKVKDRFTELKERFNKRKQDRFDELNAQAEVVKKTRSDATESLSEYNSVINLSISEQIKYKKELEELKAGEIEKPKSWEDILSENEEYGKILSEIKSLEDELNNVTVEDNSELLSEIENKIQEVNSTVGLLRDELSNKKQFEKITDLIKDIEKEQKHLIDDLSRLEKKEDIAKDFQERAGRLLEDEVNSHFSYVKFNMFREYNNGNKEPYCECTHNGIPYSDLNSADKINCGLDIINTLCRIYQSAAPIVIDNAESVNKLLPTDGQQIRLYVSEDNTLTIK